MITVKLRGVQFSIPCMMSDMFFLLQLAHPILETLKGTERGWLVDLLYAFNSGNIAKFDDLKKQWQTQVSVFFYRMLQTCLFSTH